MANRPTYLKFMLELLCDSRNVHKLCTVGQFAKVEPVLAKRQSCYSTMLLF